MFTIKLYRGEFRQDIIEAESFTVLRYDGKDPPPNDAKHAEITVHRSDIRSDRHDIYPTVSDGADQSGPPRWSKAIIENRFGKTTEIIQFSPFE